MYACTHMCIYSNVYTYCIPSLYCAMYKYTYAVAMVIVYHVCAMVVGGTVLGHVLGQ